MRKQRRSTTIALPLRAAQAVQLLAKVALRIATETKIEPKPIANKGA